MLQVIAAGDDYILIPVVGLDGGRDLVALGNVASNFLLTLGIPDDFFAALGHDGAAARAARFVVQNARKAVGTVEVGLIAGDDKVALVDTAVLHARIAAAGYLDREPQLEIID